MNPRKVMVNMLHQLLKEMEIVTSGGAGYYTCIPFAHRYNKLLEQTKKLFADEAGIVDTFDTVVEADPKDPAEKSKFLLRIRVDTTQLITFLESTGDGA